MVTKQARRTPKKPNRRRGWGTLRTMRSGRIQASYMHSDGIRYYAASTFSDDISAEAWLATERRLIELDQWTSPAERAAAKVVAGKTVREFADEWHAEKKATGQHTPKTSHLNRELLDVRILPALGDDKLSAITPADIRAWWADLRTERNTPTRNTHAYQLLKTIFNAALTDKLVTENPCQIASAGKPPPPRDVQPLTTAELDKVAESLPETYRAAVYISAWCGLRSGEVFELRRKDIHSTQDKTVIKVRRQITRVGNELVIGPPKSEAGVRDVVVPPHVATMIRDHMKERTKVGPESLVFTTTRGLRLSTTAYTKSVKKGLNEIGKGGKDGMRIHDLRHVGATWAAIAGATTKELMSRIGHATPAMAMRYQIAAADRDTAIAAEMSKLVGK